MAGMARLKSWVIFHIRLILVGHFWGVNPMSVSNHETSWLYICIYIFILEDCWTVNVGYQTGHSIEAGKIIATSPQPGPPKW